MSDNTEKQNTEYVVVNGFRVRAGVLRIYERAAELNLSHKTLRREIRAGRLGMVRLGDLIYLSEQHVADWLLTNERKARKAA